LVEEVEQCMSAVAASRTLVDVQHLLAAGYLSVPQWGRAAFARTGHIPEVESELVRPGNISSPQQKSVQLKLLITRP